ncbi:hypothetical protein GW17_00014026 [Ensete ventricosum]|nr:hypothetical protein GW17_00014026 [Ensete ventricosum]
MGPLESHARVLAFCLQIVFVRRIGVHRSDLSVSHGRNLRHRRESWLSRKQEHLRWRPVGWTSYQLPKVELEEFLPSRRWVPTCRLESRLEGNPFGLRKEDGHERRHNHDPGSVEDEAPCGDVGGAVVGDVGCHHHANGYKQLDSRGDDAPPLCRRRLRQHLNIHDSGIDGHADEEGNSTKQHD